jgi:hypothetical protein
MRPAGMSFNRHIRTAIELLHDLVLWGVFAACVSVIAGVSVAGLSRGGLPTALGADAEAVLLGFDCAGDNNAVVVIFRGVRYRTETLERAWIRTGARLGDASLAASASCSRGSRIHVYAVRGVPPGRAISRGGSSRKLAVRMDACPMHAPESAFLRCLRRD